MNEVKRFQPETIYGDQPWYTSEANMDESQHGEYVSYKDYLVLLNEYNNLKFRMEGLDK